MLIVRLAAAALPPDFSAFAIPVGPFVELSRNCLTLPHGLDRTFCASG
jgi:hypothetical protein